MKFINNKYTLINGSNDICNTKINESKANIKRVVNILEKDWYFGVGLCDFAHINRQKR